MRAELREVAETGTPSEDAEPTNSPEQLVLPGAERPLDAFDDYVDRPEADNDRVQPVNNLPAVTTSVASSSSASSLHRPSNQLESYLVRLRAPGGVEVDKYCYGFSLLKRTRKMIRLIDDAELRYWSKNKSSSSAVSVPMDAFRGVVFGAYTITFKRQRRNMPPHWAAFSLVGNVRTWDFSACSPETVECCVLGLQHVIWERSQSIPQSVFPSWKPWPLGCFLWMRLRFRLQEQAQKGCVVLGQALWIVFMQCAFTCSDDHSKSRFIDMARKLMLDHDDIRQVDGTEEMRNLQLKMRFQKERVQAIIQDRYECQLRAVLPRAPVSITLPDAPSYSSEMASGSGSGDAHV